MRTAIAIIFSSLLLSSLCQAQRDLLPAYPDEIVGAGEPGSVAIFKGDNKPFTGILVEYKTNRRLGEYKNGYKHGLFREYYSNGRPKAEARYENGLKTGIHTSWFSDGNKLLECSYENGQKNGTCAEWFQNKQLKSSLTFANGQEADGVSYTYTEFGFKESETEYKDSKVIRSAKYAFGKLTELSEWSVELYPNGERKSAGYLKNGKKDGIWTSWFQRREGEIALGTTVAGPRKSAEGPWNDGTQEGHWTIWREDGTKEYEGSYLNGKKDGIGTWYGKDITYVGSWKNDLKEGYGTFRWRDGSLNYQGDFKGGVPDGRGTTYDKGKKVYEGEWKGGKRHGKGEWHLESDGSDFVFSGSFVDGQVEGQATMTQKDRDGSLYTFTGEWKKGLMHNGLLYTTIPSGTMGVTEFKEGVKGKTTRVRKPQL